MKSKQILAIFLIIALAVTFGMGAKGCFCKNYDTVETALKNIITKAKFVADAIAAEFPDTPFPAAEQLIYDTAMTAIDMANAALLKICPTDADVQNIVTKINQATAKAQSMGLTAKSQTIVAKAFQK